MLTRNNFNSVAIFYDRLSRLVFGQKIKDAQLHSLKYITPDSSIIIVGGGTGWILEEIAKVFPSGLNITYVDKSFKMITMSRKRNIGLNTVEFINAAVEGINLPAEKYDVILTPFFLDCFSESNISQVFNTLNTSLKNGGRWINIDFHLSDKSPAWQKAMVWVMYSFFHLFTHIDATKLPDIDKLFSDYVLLFHEKSFRNFIHVSTFRKKQG